MSDFSKLWRTIGHNAVLSLSWKFHCQCEHIVAILKTYEANYNVFLCSRTAWQTVTGGALHGFQYVVGNPESVLENELTLANVPLPGSRDHV